MTSSFRSVDRLTLLLLILHIAAVLFYGPYVEQAFRRANSLLGRTDYTVPTSGMFLGAVFNFGIYFLARFWGNVGPKIFTLQPGFEARLRQVLLAVRVAATVGFFWATMRIISAYVPDYLDKLPWP
jgi:hypothetical protein